MALHPPIAFTGATLTERPDGDELRLMLQSLLGMTSAQEGVVGSNSFKVQEKATPNMSVDILSGPAFTGHDEITPGGLIFDYNDATVNVVVPAADATNPRKDLVILNNRDKTHSGVNADSQLSVVPGTPAASPAEPNPTSAGFKNYQVLAMLDIPAASTSVINARITDRRQVIGPSWAVPNGTAQYPAAPFVGQPVYDISTQTLKVWDGATWTTPYQRDWTSFTPVVLNAGQAAVAKTVNYAKYARHGKLIIAEVDLALTANSAGSGAIRVDLPVTAARNGLIVGTFNFYDVSITTGFVGMAFTANAGTQVEGYRDNVNPFVAMASSIATGDSVRYAVAYEAAAA